MNTQEVGDGLKKLVDILLEHIDQQRDQIELLEERVRELEAEVYPND